MTFQFCPPSVVRTTNAFGGSSGFDAYISLSLPGSIRTLPVSPLPPGIKFQRMLPLNLKEATWSCAMPAAEVGRLRRQRQRIELRHLQVARVLLPGLSGRIVVIHVAVSSHHGLVVVVERDVHPVIADVLVVRNIGALPGLAG